MLAACTPFPAPQPTPATNMLSRPTPTEINNLAESGIEGQATIGPMCPVMKEGQECPDQPYQTWLIILDSQGQQVARIETDSEGKFRLNLPPGEYLIHPEIPADRPLPTAADVPVTVLAGQFTAVKIEFDSGIR
jgi:hypothetical protein